MLLYDECGTTVPLRKDDYFLVNFDTVEKHQDGPEELVRYSIHVFSDGTIIFFENGQVQTDGAGRSRVTEIDGQKGKATFGRSPRCDFDHLVVEYEIELSAAGGDSYSPDPLFWGGTPPNKPPVAVDDTKDIEDRPRDDISVLSNDSDPDGSLDPGSVAIVNAPGHGTVRVSGGVVTYEKGQDFEDTDEFSYTVADNEGATSNQAKVTITGNCPTDLANPVLLPPVTATDILGQISKGYRVSYDPLPLTFTTVPARDPAYCSLNSNTGVLKVRLTCLHPFGLCPSLFPPFIPVVVANSTATASLDFYRAEDAAVPPVCDFQALRNNCSLNSPAGGSIFVKWHTDGFDIRDSLTGSLGYNTGPFTFWANLNALASPKAPLAAKVQAAETYFHTTLIDHLASIDRFAIVQEPPAEILITDPSGAQTGKTTGGAVVNGITGSIYTNNPDGTAATALILNPPPGQYQVLVHGPDGSPFNLSMAVVDLFGDARNPGVTETIRSGTTSPSGNTFSFNVPVEHRPPLPRLATRPGFDATELPPNDDGSTAAVPIGFGANFFGRQFNSAFVNNNGNLTLDAPLATFTPFDLSSTQRSIIAPFFADVDTRRGNTVHYGSGTVDGHAAFGATWPSVGCYNQITSVRNDFQVILVDRSDVNPGDFDIEFNYNRIQWETGTASGGNLQCQGGSSARAGFAKGTGEPGTFVELPGSGIPGAFLDLNQDTGLINHSIDSPVRGRYVFAVRNGAPVTADADRDGVRDELDNCPDTANPDQRDAALDGIGDACEPPGRLHATAGFLQAGLDGRTSVEPAPLGIDQEPSLVDRLVKIVTFRLAAGLATSAQTLTANLVASLVEAGLVPASGADALIQAVLSHLNRPPDCHALHPYPATLWPPNHKFVPITVSGATDPDDNDTITTTVDAISQDEPMSDVDGVGPDATLTNPPSAGASLRSERVGTGDGRVYRLHVIVRDNAGSSCTGTVTVAVPHDQAHAPVDSAPPSYNSLSTN